MLTFLKWIQTGNTPQARSLLLPPLFSPCIVPRRIKDTDSFLPQAIIYNIWCRTESCLPVLVLYSQKLSWSQHLTLQSRASLQKPTAICVLPPPRAKCLQIVRATQGWTRPVSQLEEPVMNHHGLMSTELRIMHWCRRLHPNSPPEMNWLLWFYFLF